MLSLKVNMEDPHPFRGSFLEFFKEQRSHRKRPEQQFLRSFPEQHPQFLCISKPTTYIKGEKPAIISSIRSQSTESPSKLKNPNGERPQKQLIPSSYHQFRYQTNQNLQRAPSLRLRQHHNHQRRHNLPRAQQRRHAHVCPAMRNR
ncbi:hypothetical protein L6164_005938 [Bauhinia variegata]|uniref:Uncharacterized protein n=1 Tax=Bauhinia variegata TaxID=167791 RepID=A0ACB9PSP8_BAUVA|nr:hypothetical protein L6164_005938 [Bauhinia variegata]